MPNPNIGELLDFVTQLEAAGASILTAGFAGITPALAPQIVVSRDSDTLETPRIGVQFTVGPAILQFGAIGQANPKQVPVAYLGTFALTIATTRPNDNAKQNPLHGTLVGFSRYFFSAGAKAFTETNLPWLQLLEMLPAQCAAQMQENKEQDLDVLTWDAKFAIRDQYWPALP